MFVDNLHILLIIAGFILCISLLVFSKNKSTNKKTISKKKSSKLESDKNVPLTSAHDAIIKKFIENYSNPVKTPYIIGVYGGSGSGKTFVCQVICGTIKQMFTSGCQDVVIMSQDSYYNGGNADTNYDIPSAIDFELFIKHVKQLLNGKSIECPIYDFVTHSRKKETITIHPAKIIIIEGILICTQEELRNLFNMKIFVDATESTQVFRRLERDVKERGRTIEEVHKRYKRDVAPSYKQYVLPSAQFTDMTINNNDDELYVGLEAVLNHIITVLNNVCKNS